MALILKGGAIFLHIPKTGGNWVTAVLEEAKLVEGRFAHKHATMDRLLAPIHRNSARIFGWWGLRKIRARLQPKPYVFCFVRHPLTWYESWFKYMTQPSRQWRSWGNEKDLIDWHPNAALNGCGSSDFNEFVRAVVKKRPGYVTELYASYAQPQIDFVGKQETIREDLVKVLRHLNLKFDEQFVRTFNPVGVSPEPSRKVTWDTALREEVLQLEQVALIRYGYPTEPSERF